VSRTDHTEPLVVYSDYVCPFCYLGKISLERYLADRTNPPTVEWRPFDLRGHKRRPDGTVDHGVADGKDDEYFEQARRNVETLSERYDVEVSLDISFEVDSWPAQQAALFVRESVGEEAVARFHDAVFDAMWQDGADIGDPDVLASLATSVDVDGDAVGDAAASERWDERLREAFTAARAAGVSAVPTFVYGERAARGAVPPEQLTRLVEGV
jgi:predicted DsbA family dithiol-disulfide isomerase